MGADGREITNQAELLEALERPSWNRLFMIYDAMKIGISIKTIQKLTRIDMWFLQQIEELIALEKKLKNSFQNIPKDLLLKPNKKVMPIGKLHICLRCLESEVYKPNEKS